jgi:uncharacterized protein with HEPN domain
MIGDRTRLKHILDAAGKIEEFVHGMKQGGFAVDSKTQSAVIYQLQIIGEAAKRVSKDIKDRHPDVDWETFADVRDALAHEYFRVEPGDVWKTATEDIPQLRTQVEGILAELESGSKRGK